MILIPMEPAHSPIIHLQVVLPIFMLWMVSHGVKYGLHTKFGLEFDPDGYGDALSWNVFEMHAIQKDISPWCKHEVIIDDTHILITKILKDFISRLR